MLRCMEEEDLYEEEEYDLGTRDDALGTLQRGIEHRQRELNQMTVALADEEASLSRLANSIRVTTIVLGAAIALRELIGRALTSPITAVVFTCLGAAVSVIAGLESAFKFTSRSTEMRVLAAQCQATSREVDTKWRLTVAAEQDPDRKILGARALMEIQDQRLGDVQTRAVALGLNVIRAAAKIPHERVKSLPAA
jgi:hypothetical protein